VEESLNVLSHSPLSYLIKAEKAETVALSGKNVNLDKEQCGLKHSPTMVKKAFTPDKRQRGATLSGILDDVVEQTAQKISPFLKKVS